MIDRRNDTLADLYYLIQYATLLRQRIEDGELGGAEVGYATRLADLAQRVERYVRDETVTN